MTNFWVITNIEAAFSGRSKQCNRHFVDRDPPSDESKSDYLTPLDLNLGELCNIYIASPNYYHSMQTVRPSKDESIVTTYA